MSKVKFTIICFYILYNNIHGYSQNYAQVTHTQGTQNVDGIMVTVNSTSFVSAGDILCENTIPYVIGWHDIAGDGSYTFSFYPAVSSLSLNFSCLSNVVGHFEEIKLYLNGNHFPLTTIGTKNDCDYLGTLSSQGNIIGCPGCPCSGWNGTIINGSVYTLTVFDTVYIGQPGGAAFSLFIYGNPLNSREENINTFNSKFSPNPFSEKSSLKMPIQDNLSLFIYNTDCSLIKNINVSNSNEITLLKDDYPSGVYYYQLRRNTTILSSGKLVSN